MSSPCALRTGRPRNILHAITKERVAVMVVLDVPFSETRGKENGVTVVEACFLEKLLSECDIVSLHLAATLSPIGNSHLKLCYFHPSR